MKLARRFLLILLATTFAMSAFAQSKNDKALVSAAKKGDAATVEKLLAEGANVKAVDKYNTSALMLAIQGDHADVVKVLVANGADVNEKYKYLGTPLTYAGYKSKDIVEILVANGADVDAIEEWGGDTALINAVSKGSKDVVEVLIANGADVNLPRTSDRYARYTALMYAVVRGDKDMAELLIENGANVNAMIFWEDKWNTALSYAREKGYQEIEELLLANGAGPIPFEEYAEIDWNTVELKINDYNGKRIKLQAEYHGANNSKRIYLVPKGYISGDSHVFKKALLNTIVGLKEGELYTFYGTIYYDPSADNALISIEAVEDAE